METNKVQQILSALSTHIHGKPDAVHAIVSCLIADGHVLIEDVPGVGKTTLAYALSRAIDCRFRRIQFTSDLIPSDVVGVSIYQSQTGQFEFHPGPIFANLVLADEINRASPKSQSALLEAMERSLVTADGKAYPIERPFMVVATQNPIDFESTFPLPGAQLDRFLMRISLGYPDAASERDMLRHGVLHYDEMSIEPVVTRAEVLDLQAKAREVFIEDSIYEYLHEFVTRTRHHPRIETGVSPRGALAFKLALQAAALVSGRAYVAPEDIARYAAPCLAHRIRLQDHASYEFDWQSAAAIIEEIRLALPPPHTRD